MGVYLAGFWNCFLDMPLQRNGINPRFLTGPYLPIYGVGFICPLYTFFGGLLGAVYYFFIQKHMVNEVIWLSNNLAFSFVIGFFFGVLTLDIAHSMNLVFKIKKFAKENEILVKFEELKNSIREGQERRKEKINYVFAFKTPRHFADLLDEYKNRKNK